MLLRCAFRTRQAAYVNSPEVYGGRSVQELFAYIEDADLWRWRLPESRCCHAAFGALGLELDANANPAIFDQLLQLRASELIAQVCACPTRGCNAVLADALLPHIKDDTCRFADYSCILI